MAQTAQPRPSDRFIPWYIVGFFVGFMALLGHFAYVAISGFNGVVTDDPYEKGLDYNQTIAKARAQAALGFTSTLAWEGGRLVFTLKDKDGTPLTGAKVHVMLYRPVHAGEDATYTLKPENGAYAAKLALPAPGLWEVRVHAVAPKWHYQISRRMVLE